MNSDTNQNQACFVQSAYSRLLADGWLERPDQFRKYARCFFKRFDTPTRCACNHFKEGMLICIAVSEHNGSTSYELDLLGELPDGTWIKIHNYGMPEDIEAGLATVPRLLATWEFICANPAERADNVLDRVSTMTRAEENAAIDATHPMTLNTDECFTADALAMRLVGGRHEKRELVNLIRWLLMGVPQSANDQVHTHGGREKTSTKH